MSEHPAEESFLRDHTKELAIGSAIGAMGLIFALTAKRLRAQDRAAEEGTLPDGQSEDPSGSL